jgi:hypothetical protein
MGTNIIRGHVEELITRRMSVCAICGKVFEREPITALINVQSASGVGAALAAHRDCVLSVLHPDSRSSLDVKTE